MLRKKTILINLLNTYLIDSPLPSNLSYVWNFGSLLGLSLLLQILTGIFLGMHYTPNINLAFISVEHIMRDVNYGWLIRYMHANGASLFLLFMYLHIGRGIYYGSYKSPRNTVWNIGVIIFLSTMGTAFLGYTLPWGQMSCWGATVITNLLSAIPWLGKDLVEFIWGGFCLMNATLNRFFALHYLLPFILVGLVIIHILCLHENGSSNPLGITSNIDRIPFHPFYTLKDIVGILMYIGLISIFVYYFPNLLGHTDNYIKGNPLVTPTHISPEWYFLPFYGILRSIPNKLFGVIIMFGSILILLFFPLFDKCKIRSNQFRPIMKLTYWFFIFLFGYLGYLGGKPVEDPYILLGQVSTILYFSFYIYIYIVSNLENTLLK